MCSCVEYVFTDFVAEPVTAETADIAIRVQRIEQLFDSLDPSPFREKSLDADFEITSAIAPLGARQHRQALAALEDIAIDWRAAEGAAEPL